MDTIEKILLTILFCSCTVGIFFVIKFGPSTDCYAAISHKLPRYKYETREDIYRIRLMLEKLLEEKRNE